MDEAAVTAVTDAIKQSKKYRDTSAETIAALVREALPRYRSRKQVEKAVRQRLHSIMAPYLGDPDYDAEAAALTAAFAAGETAVRDRCWQILGAHLSTRERLPILPDFYPRIWSITGRPASIMDIACGINPLALPWMDLGEWSAVSRQPSAVSSESPVLSFHAYDIHEPRVQFINHFFTLAGLPPLARVQDVGLAPPQQRADVALFLKEMPRFARNYPGQERPLLDAIQAHWLVLSFPAVSTHGGRSLVARYRQFMHELVDGKNWPLTELLFDGELVFCVEKGAG